MSHDRPSLPTAALTREAARVELSPDVSEVTRRSLEDPLVRRSIARAYLQGNVSANDAPSTARWLVITGLSAFAGLAMPLDSRFGAALLSVAAAGFVIEATRLMRARRSSSRAERHLLDGAGLRAHLDRAVFNCGEKWSRLSLEHRQAFLERDLVLLLADVESPEKS